MQHILILRIDMSLKTSICCYQQKYVILNILEDEIVSKNEMDAIFEQINKLNKPISTKEQEIVH